MAAQTLRALARKYAKGELERDAYVRSRAEFVEAVLSGEIHLQVNDYPAPRSAARAEGENTRRRARKKKEEQDITSILVSTGPTPTGVSPASIPDDDDPIELPPVEEEPRSSVPYLAAGAGAVVVVAALIWALWPSSPKPVATPAPNAGSAVPEEVVEEAPAPAPLAKEASDLLLKFLAAKDWSDAARSDFVNQWNALPEDQRAGAAQSGEMAQLNNMIYKKLLEERALSGLGDAAASLEKQRALVDFATSLGIQDSRLTVPSVAP